MAERPKRVAGTEVVLESSGALLTDGSILELTDDDLQAADVAGLFTATFEFDVVDGFSEAPTTGNSLHVYEQKINSDGTDAPDVEADFKKDYLCSFEFNDSDVAQYLRKEGVPVNLTGGKYWVEWEDGGAGTASISATWAMRVIMEDIQSETV